MSYTKRVWENTGEEVTYEDFNRIEEGIEANDLEISKQKDATKEGSLAKQIADIKDETQEGSLAQKIADAEEQINVCAPKNQPLFTSTRDNSGGGEILLQAPKSESAEIKSNIRIDVYGNKIRFFEDGNGYKGANLNISKCSGVDNCEIATSETKPFNFANGWRSVNTAYLNDVTKNGKSATMNLIIYNEAQASASRIIGYTPFPPSKNLCGIATMYEGTCVGIEMLTTGELHLLIDVPAHSWLAINISYTTN